MISQFINLIAIEFTKLKRSQALLMTLLCPLSVVGLQFLMVVEGGGKFVSDKGWDTYWYGAMSLWYMLMFPLYVALITSLVNGIEHKQDGWRFMATLPIKQWQVFVVKGLVSWLFVFIASVLMYLFTSASIVLMMLIGYDAEVSFTSPFLLHLTKAMVAALPIITLGHVISWRIKNIILPLALGVIMTIIASTVARSKYWVYDPWTYHIAATLNPREELNFQAIALGAVLGLSIFVLSAWLLNKREVFS
ncbi:ABC transporter permease [Glaciecola sp. XM2]|jgi:hypothetical protein|uniref:ABC transporter permease n=1 Tax=Glaciecola sp. XM2 TaxID=1914931 RepID=UPI001BDEE845|nr:ABC transporter permease [Glaciecola sp. XM2]MBT1452131.1 ABC transporter permease [Glaciecola sp. XM2]